MLDHPIWTISRVQPTNISQIFIPEGELTPNADYATLILTQNISTLCDEYRQLCQTSDVIKEFIGRKVPKDLSSPNKRILRVLQQNIRNTCDEITSTWSQIINSFGLTQMDEAKEVAHCILTVYGNQIYVTLFLCEYEYIIFMLLI